MPREKELSSRLDSLLEAIFGERPDPFAIFWEIASDLRPEQHLAFKKRIRRTLRAKAPIGTDSALLVACVLRLTGFAPHRLLHFLSLYIPGTLRLSQFEFAVQALFTHGLPIPETMIYDLTQYTYLEKRLLVRKSMEVSAKLKDALSPDLLLYLYLLSLRDDLSNENVQLIALIMKNCFPALELRTRLGGATLEEYGEIAKAWRYAEQRTLSLDAAKADAARAARPFNRESASFFLDKYFSDTALAKQQEEAAMEALVAAQPSPRSRRSPRRAQPRAEAMPAAADEPLEAAPAEALPTSASRAPAAPPRARQERPAHAAQRAPQAAATAAARSAPATVAAAAATRRARAVEPASAAAPSPQRRKPARLASRASAAEPRPRQGVAATRRLPSLLPSCVAAVIALALTILAVRFLPLPADRAPDAAAPSAAAASAAPAAPATPDATAAAPERTYVVQQGDSLWKIYQTLGVESPSRWEEFLSRMRAENSLIDPDHIRPGKVLKLQPTGN